MDQALVTFFGDAGNDDEELLSPEQVSDEIQMHVSCQKKCQYNGKQRPQLHTSQSCGSFLQSLPSSLPPEIEEGNIEYKLKLVRPTPSRLEHLVTQLKWRLAEGQGQAVYELGVEDNGVVLGLSKQELNESLKTLGAMCARLSASYTVLRERQVAAGTRKAQEILIRRMPSDKVDLVETRLAVLGNLDAGKSSLLGVLTQGDLDNGRGRARLNLFRHPHEIQTGYTSSVSSEILGFDSRGRAVNYSGNRSLEAILEESSKLYRLIDLAGHVRYQKTTLRGLTAHDPHLVLLVVSSVTGLTDMAQEHAALAVGLQVPFIVVINKIDLCDHQGVLAAVETWLKATGNKRVPLVVRTKDDAITAAENMMQQQQVPDRVTPVFPLSCVTGAGLPLLLEFLNVLPSPRPGHAPSTDAASPTCQEFCVDSVAAIPDTCPPQFVLSGPVLSGVLREGDLMKLGPGSDCAFAPVRVTSLNRNRIPCCSIQAGHWASVTVALDSLEGSSTAGCRAVQGLARRGAFLVPLNSHSPAVMSFTARIDLMGRWGLEKLRCGQKLSALCGSVCQLVKVLDDRVPSSVRAKRQQQQQQQQQQQLSEGTGLSVTLSFTRHPELIRPCDRLLLRCGHRVLGTGRVLSVVNLLDNEN